MLADSVRGEGCLPGLQMTTVLSVSSRWVGVGDGWGKKARSLLYKPIVLSR